MSVEKFLIACTLLVLTSCASKKTVTEKSSTKKTTKELVDNNKTLNERETGNQTDSSSSSNNINNNSSNSSTNNNNSSSAYSNSNSTDASNQKVYTETPAETIAKTYSGASSYTQDYVDRFAPIAIREMHKYKIPASVTLAQGVLESGSGRSPLALKSNNHFGIKCHKGWKGSSVSHDDDAIGECFRKYEHPESSYEDHSKFLTSRSRYAKLFKLNITDYVGWSYGLKKAGYATDKAYPRKLITIIKKYHLYKYDTAETSGNTYVSEPVTSNQATLIHQVIKGDTLYSLSKRYGTTVEFIKDLNGLSNNTISIGQELLIP